MRDGARSPALVNVHGGGTNSYLRTQNLIEQYLASKGYVVLAINYRGGSGFGREFQDLGVNDWASGQAHDAAIAADFLRTLPYVNGKVGIYGYSYGGIMSMATIARYPDKYDAAVPMAGIYDFADALTNADRLGKIFTQTGHGGPPAAACGSLRAQQHTRTDSERQDTAAHHARRGGRPRTLPPIPTGGRDPQEEQQGVREQELSRRAARLPESSKSRRHVQEAGGVLRQVPQKPKLGGGMKRISLMVLAAAVCSVHLTAQPKPKLALVGGMLLDGYEVPPLHHAVVLVEGDRIVAKGRVGEVTIPADAKVIDTSGRTMLPGLIDCTCTS